MTNFLSQFQQPARTIRMIADRNHYYDGRTVMKGESYDVLAIYAEGFQKVGTAHFADSNIADLKLPKVETPILVRSQTPIDPDPEQEAISEAVAVDPMTTENTSPLMPGSSSGKGKYQRRDMKPKAS